MADIVFKLSKNQSAKQLRKVLADMTEARKLIWKRVRELEKKQK